MIVGLDIGTNCIRVAVGDADDSGAVQIAGTAAVKSAGLRNGVIVNIEAAAGAIKEAVGAAEQNAGMEIYSCVTAIGGAQVEGINSRGVVPVNPRAGQQAREITRQDVDHVINSAAAMKTPLDRERLHVIAQDYIVDGTSGIKDPIHRLGVRLEAEVHIVTASKTTIQNVSACVDRAGYHLSGVMHKALAASQSVVHDDEMDLGSIVIDLGAGSTDILVVLHGAPVCTASIPVGGNLVTNDIAIVKGISMTSAEKIKVESGCCWQSSVQEGLSVIIPGVGGRPPEEIQQDELCQIIMPRMEEILTMVRSAVIHKTNLTQLSGNIILTGGGARMEGVVELAQDVFGTSSVRIGIPEKLGGIEEDYREPEWATAVGLVLANRNSAGGKSSHKGTKRSFPKERESLLKRLKKSFF